MDRSNHLLDCVDIGALIVDKAGNPRFLNRYGSTLLNITNRSELPRQVLEPLIEIAARPSRVNSFATHRHSEVIALPSTPPRTVFAVTRTIPAEETLVTFYNLDSIEPLFSEQAKFLRRTAVRAAARMPGILSRGGPLETRAGENTDLLTGVTEVIEIIDSLVARSTKISADIKTSALLAIAPGEFIEILGYLLLEFADFVGAGGTVRLKGVLDPSEQRLPHTHDERFAEIVILAEHGETKAGHLSPFERHLSSRGAHYRVTIADEEPTIRQFASGEFLLDPTSAGRLNTSLSPETFSGSLRAAHECATRASVELQVRKHRRDLLTAYVQFRITLNAAR